jgi:C1A family cysteine protease
VLVVGIFMVLSPVRVGAGGLSVAPVNPAFVEYLQKRNVQLVEGFGAVGNPLSYLPSPLNRPSVKAEAALAGNDTLPAAFDLRTVDGVTPVKDQGNCGSCWAFATYGSLESYLKYRHSSHKTWDFSEADMNQYHGFDVLECDGGNFDMATAYLARWGGPVNSSDVPYPYASAVLGEAPGAKVRKHVQNAWYLPERTAYTDNTQVKTALMTYGAVSAAMYNSAAYYNENTAAYYYNGPKGIDQNHGVAIVGWDDNYPRTNFTAGRRPPGKGAFIVKNSWGKEWGKDGYFYLSYYDKKLSLMVSYYNAEWPGNYQRAYEYDPLGWTTSVGYSSTTAWFANVFNAGAGAAQIEAVSFYTPVPASTYRIYIYKDVTGTNPRNGVLIKTLSGTIGKPGYHTIRTFKPPAVSPAVVHGSKFSIVVKLTTPGYDFPIPVEKDFSWYSSAANAYEGQSYVSPDGKNWDDLTLLSSFERTNVCLKAFGS